MYCLFFFKVKINKNSEPDNKYISLKKKLEKKTSQNFSLIFPYFFFAKVEDFLDLTYRWHAVRLLDCVLRAEFYQV